MRTVPCSVHHTEFEGQHHKLLSWKTGILYLIKIVDLCHISCGFTGLQTYLSFLTIYLNISTSAFRKWFLVVNRDGIFRAGFLEPSNSATNYDFKQIAISRLASGDHHNFLWEVKSSKSLILKFKLTPNFSRGTKRRRIW